MLYCLGCLTVPGWSRPARGARIEIMLSTLKDYIVGIVAPRKGRED